MTVLARFPRDGRDELVVIGAAKAGSTSLHNYLALHPEISMSHDKEVRYFTDRTASRGSAGRSTPGVVDRMADLTPDARLIYPVRDPVERPQPSEETLARVRAIPAPEVAELRELTGRPLAGWSV